MTELRDIEDKMRAHPDPVVTVPELADEFGVSDTHMRDQLKLLERAGAVESKTVGANAVAWWHEDRVCERHVAPEDHPDQSDLKESAGADDAHSAENQPVAEDIESIASSLDLPGSAKRLQERREAVAQFMERLRFNGGEVNGSELAEAVYEANSTGYADAESFWNNCGKKAMKQLRDRDVVELVDRHDGIYQWKGDPR